MCPIPILKTQVLTFEFLQGNVAEGSNRLDRSYFYYIYPRRKI